MMYQIHQIKSDNSQAPRLESCAFSLTKDSTNESATSTELLAQ